MGWTPDHRLPRDCWGAQACAGARGRRGAATAMEQLANVASSQNYLEWPLSDCKAQNGDSFPSPVTTVPALHPTQPGLPYAHRQLFLWFSIWRRSV